MSDWHWHELASADLQGSADFYNKTFGWEVESVEFGGDPYNLLKQNGVPIGGIGPAAPGAPAGWNVFIRVADCDVARQTVIQNGGSVHFGPTTIPGVGRIAGCADPGGAEFTLIEPDG